MLQIPGPFHYRSALLQYFPDLCIFKPHSDLCGALNVILRKSELLRHIGKSQLWLDGIMAHH